MPRDQDYPQNREDTRPEPPRGRERDSASADPAREFFLNRPLGGLIVKNALPAVASMLFISLYQVVDGIMVGRRLGPEALASVNILYPVVAVFIGLAVMIGVGGNARIAVLLGAGETKKARRVLGLIAALGGGLGIAGSAAVAFILPDIIALLGASGVLGEYAGQYLQALYPFAAPMILSFILEQSVRNDGRPNLATAVMAFSALLNIFLDYYFLFVLNMGISGAALATGIAQSLAAAFFLAYFLVKSAARRPGLAFGLPGGGSGTLWIILANGFSEFFTELAGGVATFLFNRSILHYVGPLGVAAYSLAQYLMIFGIMIVVGMGTGTQPILSYNHGAGLFLRVREALARLLAASLAVAGFFFLLLHWQAEPLAAFFIPEHPQALDLAVQVTKIMSWSLLLAPAGIVGSIVFATREKVGSSLAVAVGRGLLCTVLGLAIFPPLWGQWGIWITPVFSEGVTALLVIFLVCRWHKEEGR